MEKVALSDLLAGAGVIASIGSPGAGKSTFFDNIDDPDWLRLEKDRFREALFGSRRAFWDHPSSQTTRSNMVKQAMLTAMHCWHSYKVFLTDTGGTAQQINDFYTPLSEAYSQEKQRKLPITLIVFQEPLDVLLERNNTRPVEHRVTDDLLREKYDMTYGPEAWWRSVETNPMPGERVIRREQIVV